MPKLNLGDPNVTVADIQQQIAEIEYLLDSRIDTDNMQVSGSNVAKIGVSRCNGLAMHTRPVQSDKFFATPSEDVPNSFLNRVVTPLYELVDKPQFDVLTTKFAFDIKKDNDKLTADNSGLYAQASADSFSDVALANRQLMDQMGRELRADRRRIEEEAGQSTTSLGKVLRGMLIGAATGGVFGSLAPIPDSAGMFGAFIGASASGIVSQFGGMKGEIAMLSSSVSGLLSLGNAYSETKYIRHPRNYRFAIKEDMLSFIDPAVLFGSYSWENFLTQPSEDRRRRVLSQPLITTSMSQKLTYENNSSVVHPEFVIVAARFDEGITAVNLFVTLKVDSAFFDTSDAKNRYTMLSDVDILYKVVP